MRSSNEKEGHSGVLGKSDEPRGFDCKGEDVGLFTGGDMVGVGLWVGVQLMLMARIKKQQIEDDEISRMNPEGDG
jgi:hypothetical protein